MSKQFTYTLKIDAEIKDLLAKMNQVQTSMQSMMDAGKIPGAKKMFDGITRAMDDLQKRASVPITSEAAFGALSRDLADARLQMQKLGSEIERVRNLSNEEKLDFVSPDLKKKIDDTTAALEKYDEAAKATQETIDKLAKAEKAHKEATKKKEALETSVTNSKSRVDAQQKVVDINRAEVRSIEEKIKALREYKEVREDIYNRTAGEINSKWKRAKDTGRDVSSDDAVDASLLSLETELKEKKKVVTKSQNTLLGYEAQLQALEAQLDAVVTSLSKLETAKNDADSALKTEKTAKAQQAYTDLVGTLKKLDRSFEDLPLEYTEENLKALKNRLQELTNQGLNDVNSKLNVFEQGLTDLGVAANNTSDALSRNREEMQSQAKITADIDAMSMRIKQFVGLQGAALIARKALKSAIESIRELDAVMTEMAVVTDLDIGDYWDQLPEHTARANELGTAITNVYKAETLYYQQGLKTNEVIGMSTKTLQMARVAGLSAEDATNKMTAALRGFNMELNETSAQRVADVYSELAAITASDVNEISSAMTKTASIAASAGMEFETTAAFLSQIIETTRESAETAGTAMKTVIARFQELKKSPSEIGEVEGEIVDANAIETALRSVGVSLRDANGQFRELDEVFLELSSKWDSLDKNTQRYIATIAAGSRQQSRFIAMMSDYERTQELVTAANNSAGASAEQYEKTLESFESKVQQLQNAWKSFSMGLANSDLIKGAITALTKIVTILDKMTSGVDGLANSLSKISLIFVVVKTGKTLLQKFGETIKKFFMKLGKEAGKGFRDSMTDSLQPDRAPDPNDPAAKWAKPNNATKGKLGAFWDKTGFGTGYHFAKEAGEAQADADAASAAISRYKIIIDDNTEEVSQRLEDFKVDFVSKFKALGGSCDQAEKAWKSYEESIVKGGDDATAAIALMDQELEDLAKELKKTDPSATIDPANLKVAQKSYSDYAAAAKKAEQENSDATKKMATAQQTFAEKTKEANYKATAATDAFASACDKTGMALVAIGAAATFVGTQLENMGIEGMEETMSKLSTVLTSVGGGISGVGSLMKNLGVSFKGGMVSIGKTTMSLKQFGIWALIITAAIAALTLAINYFSNNTTKGKARRALESAEDAAKSASDAADEAKESFEGLSKSLESLEGRYDGLEKMVKGTEEWKKAVKETNAEVLALIDKYPELASLFEKNADGILSVKEGGEEKMNEILADKERTANALKAAEVAAKARISQAKTDYGFANLSNKSDAGFVDEHVWGATIAGGAAGAAGGAWGGAAAGGAIGSAAYGIGAVPGAIIGGIAGGVIGGSAAAVGAHAAAEAIAEDFRENSQEYTEQMAKAFAEGDLSKDATAEEIAKHAHEVIGIDEGLAESWGKQLEGNTEELTNFGTAVLAAEAEMDAYNTQMAMLAAEAVNTSGMTDAQKNIINTATNGDFIEQMVENANTTLAEETKGMGKKEYKEWAKQQAMQLYGTEDVTVDNKGNVTVGTGDEAKTYTREQFESQLTSAQASEEMTKALQNLPNEIEKASKNFGGEAGKAFKKVFEKSEGKGLTQNEIAALKGTSDAELEKAYNESPALQTMYGSVEEYTKAIRESTRMASDRFDLAFGKLQSYGIDTKDLGTKLTSEAAEGFASGMNVVYAQSGEEGVKTINAMVNAMTEGLSDDEAQSFYSALSGLDWSSIQSLDTFGTVLESLGVEIPTNELQGFVDELKNAAGAINKISFDTVISQAKTATDVLKLVNEGTFKITQEQFDKLAPSLKKYYQFTEDGYQFYGNTKEFKAEVEKDRAGAQRDFEQENAIYLFGQTEDYKSYQPPSYLKTTYDNLEEVYKHGTDLDLENYLNAVAKKHGISNLQLAQQMDKEGFSYRGLAEALLGPASRKRGAAANILNSTINFSGGEDGMIEFLTEGVSIAGTSKEKEHEEYVNELWYYIEKARSLGLPLSDLGLPFGDNTKKSDLESLPTSELKKYLESVYLNRTSTFSERLVSSYADIIAGGDMGGVFRAITAENKTTQQAGRMALETISRNVGMTTQADRYAEINELLEDTNLGEKERNKLLAERVKLEEQMLSVVSIVQHNENIANSYEKMANGVKEYNKAVTKMQKLSAAMSIGQLFGINVNEKNYEQFMSYIQQMLDPATASTGFGNIVDFYSQEMFPNLSSEGKEQFNSFFAKGSAFMQFNEAGKEDPLYSIAKQLESTGLGYIEYLSNGMVRFVRSTNEELSALAAQWADDLKSVYDVVASYTNNIESYQRTHEKLAKEYDKMMESGGEARDFKTNYREQTSALRESRRSAETIANVKREDILSTFASNQELSKYLNFDEESGEVRFTAAWFKLSDEERAPYEDLITSIFDDAEEMRKAVNTIADAEEQEEAIRKKNEDAALSMTERAKEALVNIQQKEIDTLSSINDSINEAQERLVSKMQEQIDDARQIRENEKTERELADKETRLAYLRANSAGNELEILQLEKELAEEQENYTDSLVDQALDRLTDANAEAAEQRERQIAIMEEQLELYKNSEGIWVQARELVTDAAKHIENGGDFKETDLYKLLYQTEVADTNMNLDERESWNENFSGTLGAAMIHFIQTFSEGAHIFEKMYDFMFVPGSSERIEGSNMYRTQTITGEWIETYKKYKTGGLADFTGPAWLDGTPSRPELVLNQRDTANFIVLKDILSDILSGASGLSKHGEQEGGDNYFDIDINVESLGDDYDVDQVADRIRDIIYEDSMYRNVTAVNTLR